MIEWILIVHVTATSPDFEVWGGYQTHINCLAAMERLETRYQHKKQTLRARCQPVMAVQLEPKK